MCFGEVFGGFGLVQGFEDADVDVVGFVRAEDYCGGWFGGGGGGLLIGEERVSEGRSW